ncbi:hypothetical protein RHGRI_031603 [Rhododendron griersonianum]|uniref:Uncharacterized protein n=1 Tax=Rhododendron griersonianum TaxID=479676 RepID=A0AAV6I8S1_9ERIC|nr:hypothetical protein RHGRI_031603 [Rhododendron griersonianum]
MAGQRNSYGKRTHSHSDYVDDGENKKRNHSFCVWICLIKLNREKGDRGVVDCPVFMPEICTLLADFVDFLCGCPVFMPEICTLLADFVDFLCGCPVFMPEICTRLADLCVRRRRVLDDFVELLYANILAGARSSGFVASNCGADLFLLSHDDATVAPAVYVFKGGGRSVVGSPHSGGVAIEEEAFRAFGMAVSFEDALASTCPRFVEVLRVRRYKLGIECGVVYYLKTSNDTVLFQWEKARDFEDWLASIVNARPKFIQPFYRSVNALSALVTSPHGIDHHYCWFVDVVQIRNHMTVGHSGVVNYLCWDLSGDYFASASEESVKVWSLGSGECIHELSSNGNQFHSCVFHPSYSALLVIGRLRFKEAAEPSEPFGPEVRPLPTTMESDATTEASKSDPMEDAIAASKNPKKHHALKNKKD